MAGREVRTTSCPLDCPDTCTLSVTVEGGRIVDVGAAPGNPFTQGFICQKVSRHTQRVYAPERLTTPLVRTGPKGAGEFRAVSWDDALDLVVTRIRQAQAERRSGIRRALAVQLVVRRPADRAARTPVPPHRRVRGRRHDLRGDVRQGVGRDVPEHAVGRSLRRRARAAGRRVGFESRGQQHALPAARAARAAGRRPGRRRRPAAHGDGEARRSARHAATGHRRRARAGDRARARAHGPARSTRSLPSTRKVSTRSSPPPTNGRSPRAEAVTRRRRGGHHATGRAPRRGAARVLPGRLGTRAHPQRWVGLRRGASRCRCSPDSSGCREAGCYASTSDATDLGVRRVPTPDPPRVLNMNHLGRYLTDPLVDPPVARAGGHRCQPGGEPSRISNSCSTGSRVTTSSQSCTSR